MTATAIAVERSVEVGEWASRGINRSALLLQRPGNGSCEGGERRPVPLAFGEPRFAMTAALEVDEPAGSCGLVERFGMPESNHWVVVAVQDEDRAFHSRHLREVVELIEGEERKSRAPAKRRDERALENQCGNVVT